MMGTRRACALAFLVAFVTLFTQVLVHRVVSAKLLNNFAFLVISLTMLGFALSGVLLSRALSFLRSRMESTLVTAAALFGLSLLAVSFVFYRADVGVLFLAFRPEFVAAFLRCLPLALLYALPFTCCGLMIGLLLASPELPAARVYAFDLLGSALGALLVVPSIVELGVERSIVLGALALLGLTVALLPAAGFWSRRLAALTGVLLLGVLAWPGFFEMRYPPGSPLDAAVKEGALERILWDPVARIEMMRISPPDPATTTFPSLIGDDRAFLSRFRRMLSQNNNAPTYAVQYDGRRETLAGVDRTIYAAAYRASGVRHPKVAAIGVGGGFDILTALYFEASAVTGIEVNGATVRLLTHDYHDYFKAWMDDPRVRIVHAEGRNFLTTTADRFDVIQISGVDSFSGTPGAAHVFSESYLYTVEAFALYLGHLRDEGILNMMRYEYVPPHEMLRALTTAVAALRRAGVSRPADHVVMVGSRNQHFTALLLKRTPFTPDELQRLREWTAPNPFLELAAGPGLNAPQDNAYQVFLSYADPGKEASFVAGYPFDISPVVDDRPFFFRRSFWWHLFPSSPLVWAATPALEYGLLLLLAIVGLATLVCVYLPLRWLAKGAGSRSPRRFGIYFAALGLGFMAVEIALLQKLGLFLGHPNLALSVVLAALLLGTGLGSLASGAILKALGGIRFVAYALAVLLLAEVLLVLPALHRLFSWPLGARALVAFVLVGALGVLLGVFLPVGIERLKDDRPGLVPWAWGVNGIFSVLGPILSVALSVTWGMSALALCAVPIYLLAAFVLPERARS